MNYFMKLMVPFTFVLALLVGCEGNKDTGDHLKDAGESISKAAEEAGEEISDAAKKAAEKLEEGTDDPGGNNPRPAQK